MVLLPQPELPRIAADRQRYVAENRYNVALVRDQLAVVMRRVRMDNVWCTSDPVAIFGGAQPAQ
jgi:hypothetical protein